MFIVCIGMNHKTAPVQLREKLAFPESRLPGALQEIRQLAPVRGCVVLSTCNRTEIYATVSDIKTGVFEIKQYLSTRLQKSIPEIEKYFYTMICSDALQHLFSVTSGLDSMILGETQILGQVSKSYQMACQCGMTNPVMNTLFQKAISVGKRIHTETGISQKAVSIGSAAVELAKQIYPDFQQRAVLIVGTGKIGELTTKNLLGNGVVSIYLANRSWERAQSISEELGGVAIRFSEMFECMEKVDIVIVCTSAPHYVIQPTGIKRVMEGRTRSPLYLIDLAVPRNIHPQVKDIDGVNLYTIDDLQDIIAVNLEHRAGEALEAEKLIADETQDFLKWLGEQAVVPAIVALKNKGRQIADQELSKAFHKLPNLTREQKNVIQSLANSIVNKLLHPPIVGLKQSSSGPQSHIYGEVIQSLFDLKIHGADLGATIAELEKYQIH